MQHDDCGAGPSRHLHGQPGSRPGPGRHRRHDCSAARVREIEDPACTPSSAASPTNRGTLHCSRLKLQTSFYWTVARPGGRGVPLSPAASCAEAFCGHFAAPRDFTSQTEQYVTFFVPSVHTTSLVVVGLVEKRDASWPSFSPCAHALGESENMLFFCSSVLGSLDVA